MFEPSIYNLRVFLGFAPASCLSGAYIRPAPSEKQTKDIVRFRQIFDIMRSENDFGHRDLLMTAAPSGLARYWEVCWQHVGSMCSVLGFRPLSPKLAVAMQDPGPEVLRRLWLGTIH